VSAAACIATLRCKAAASVVPSAAIIHEAMLTPAVPIAPAGPWAHAQENAVVEVARPIESHRRAFIRRIVVIPVRTHRLCAYIDVDLRLSRRRQSQPREQNSS
jgi:hypothetical protein